MKRDAQQYLKSWRRELTRKPLIIRGARQVGKTYSVMKFAREHFENVAAIDLERNRSIHSVFEGDLRADRIIADIEVLIDQKVDGIILIGDIVPENFLINEIQTKNIPVVVVERDYTNFDGPTFLVDTVKGGYLATKHLLELGYETVGAITGPIEQQTFYSSLGRFEGYRRALNDYGLSYNDAFIQKEIIVIFIINKLKTDLSFTQFPREKNIFYGVRYVIN
jgi:hypothetical protein